MRRSFDHLTDNEKRSRCRLLDAAAHRRSRGGISDEDYSKFVASVDVKFDTPPLETATKTVTVGRTFGKLTVTKLSKNKWGQTVAECSCLCGGSTKTNIAYLASGDTKSCGCARFKTDFSGKLLISSIRTTYKARAKQLGLQFDLDHAQVKHLVLADCFYCGTEPYREWSLKSRKGVESLKCNGIDRVNNELGYTPTNVVPCCPRCNYAKRDMPLSEFSAWALRLANHLQKQHNASVVDALTSKQQVDPET